MTWESFKVGDLGRIVTGKTPKTAEKDNYNGSIMFVTPSDDMDAKYIYSTGKTITEKGMQSVKGAIIPAGSICVSCIGSDLGKVVITTEECVTNQQINSIVVDSSRFDTDFIYYSMLILGKELNFHSKTSTAVPIVNKSSFSSYEIACPSLEEQIKISGVLSAIDEKIEKNERINENLLQQALCIYASLIDGKPKNGCIGDYCTLKSGFAFKSKWWQDSGVPVVKIGSINQDYLNLSDCSYVSEDKISFAKDFIVSGGDLLIAMTGATIGKFTMVPKTTETILVNQRVGKFFLGDNPVCRIPFIYSTLKQSEVISEVINRGQGSAQPNISASDIMSIPCVIPQPAEINAFNEKIAPMFELIINNQFENMALANTRDSLLPRLMSGELDVSEVEI